MARRVRVHAYLSRVDADGDFIARACLAPNRYRPIALKDGMILEHRVQQQMLRLREGRTPAGGGRPTHRRESDPPRNGHLSPASVSYPVSLSYSASPASPC